MRLEVEDLDWARIDAELDDFGVARTGPLLTAEQCRDLMAGYDNGDFRSTVVMARHGFGSGEYKYFARPLPHLVEQLRSEIYPHAARTANRWASQLGAAPFPEALEEMLALCHAAGQTKPTPLMLSYRAGDYNCLHQDIYGSVAFPLQLVVLLSAADDFSGGEFILTEQRPRMQSRAEVVTLRQGEAALFATSERPKRGTKGNYRVKMRHGVSRVRSGSRMTLGIIFHDAA
ncbi:MAG: 2OG-Fe(II) oxygenase [Pseudomonadota bacterium]